MYFPFHLSFLPSTTLSSPLLKKHIFMRLFHSCLLLLVNLSVFPPSPPGSSHYLNISPLTFHPSIPREGLKSVVTVQSEYIGKCLHYWDGVMGRRKRTGRGGEERMERFWNVKRQTAFVDLHILYSVSHASPWISLRLLRIWPTMQYVFLPLLSRPHYSTFL